MAKPKRSHQKPSDKVTPGGGGSTESGSPARSRGGSPRNRVQEEEADRKGPPRISVVQSASGDNVARNLAPELEEEGHSEGDEAVSLMVDDSSDGGDAVAGAALANAPTPITKAVNSVPPRMNPTAPDASPARMLEVLCEKHDALKHLVVTRCSSPNDVRDPGFAAMRSQQQVLNAIIGVFNTAGYSVGIRNQELILATDLPKLATAGQAIYDLFLRHQLRRWMERAVASARDEVQNEAEFKAMAERYMGTSKESVSRLKDDVMVKEGMLQKLGAHLQDFADRVAAAEADAAEARRAAAEAVAAAEIKREPGTARATAPNVKTEVKRERNFVASSLHVGSTDYLSDIYEDCMRQTQGVNATTRLRMSAVSELKHFDGRHRDEYKAKNFLSTVRSAFIRDGLEAGEACMQFPLLLADRSKTWYRQLPREVRKDWARLQREFEDEYCGGSISPQRRYFDARRKANEEALDYLYRLNVLAQDAKVVFDGGDSGAAHVEHFIDTCEDPSLARQLGALRLRQVSELRATLKEILRVDTRLKRDDPAAHRSRNRDGRDTGTRDRQVPPPIGSKARPIAVDALRALASTTASEDDFESSDDDLGGDDADEAEDSVVGVPPQESQALETLVKMIAALKQTKDVKPAAQDDRTPCTHCGSTRHRDRNCWSRLTCTACGATGHPAEHCYQRCKACMKVHERGECELTRLADQMKAWYDPSNHAGLLPPAVEKWLN